jgi:hypothetical protein
MRNPEEQRLLYEHGKWEGGDLNNAGFLLGDGTITGRSAEWSGHILVAQDLYDGKCKFETYSSCLDRLLRETPTIRIVGEVRIPTDELVMGTPILHMAAGKNRPTAEQMEALDRLCRKPKGCSVMINPARSRGSCDHLDHAGIGEIVDAVERCRRK